MHLCPECYHENAAPPRSTAAPKKKVERTANKPKIMPPVTVADDNLPMASSLDMPLIQNNMLGARDATVRLRLVVLLSISCVALYMQGLSLMVVLSISCVALYMQGLSLTALEVRHKKQQPVSQEVAQVDASCGA